MRLKKLEVFGFKSFFDKTVISFQPGITAVVGPNGCGKSNLADAILWVLGEQSPKTLRGERMEDVIFNGTELRKPLGMAEVALTFGDIENELPSPYSPYAEITVSRRLYRSGESEYLINKAPCRLKDIRDLLIDTGAGYRAHTIIEQGRVDDIISASPLQRREIVEETAGIAKYRIRKMEALRKLEATEQNLTRVRDIIGEIKRQINSLDRQARKAEKHQKLKEELKSLELQVASSEWDQWNRLRLALEQEEKTLLQERAEQEHRLSLLDLQQTEIKLSLTQKEEELSALNRQVFEVDTKIQRLEGRAETIQAQRREWNETRSRTEQEIGEIREAGRTLDTEGALLDRERSEIEQILPEKEGLLGQRQEESNTVEGDLNFQTRELEKEKTSIFDLASRMTQAHNTLAHIKERQAELLKKKERGTLEIEEVRRKLAFSQETIQSLRERLAETRRELAEKKAAHAAAAALSKETDASLVGKRARLSAGKEAAAQLSAQVASREGFYRGILGRRQETENVLLQLEGLHGMVADFIDVPTRYERAVEAVLEERLRGIVVENHGNIKKGVDFLRNTQNGRGTFFPLRPRSLKPILSAENGPEPTHEEGVIGRALDLIASREGYCDIAEVLLGDVTLVSDLDAAVRLWESGKTGTFVTLQGEVVDPHGIVTGGERGETGLLEQKREIRSLSDQIAGLQVEMKSLEERIEADQATLKGAQSDAERLTSEIRSLEMQELNAHKDQGLLLGEIDRFQNALQTVLFEQEEGTKEAEEMAQMEGTEKARLEEIARLKGEKEEALTLQQNRLGEMRQTLAALREETVQLKLQTASLKEKQHHLAEKRGRVAQMKEELAQRFQEKEQLLGALHEKLRGGEVEEGETLLSIQQNAAERNRLVEMIREKREAHAAVQSHLQELELEIQQVRGGLERVQKELQEKALKKVEAQMNQDRIKENILNAYQIEIEHHTVPETEETPPLEEAREKGAALRRSLDEIGPVNIAAIDEYRELETRYRFLTGQENDLTTSVESLHQAIAKINKTTQSLFVDTFHLLNQRFGEVFNSFFGGGRAELVLIDEAHPLESGIEMMVQPPGKKPRSITLLSGGEKALTAISLLFATFLIHPSPFCLLDEIDAPLDEENTRRFTQALVRMSSNTQFIVVTHNKRTMEIADILYGVTMEETGLSKLVSVRMNEKSESNGHPVEMPAASDLG